MPLRLGTGSGCEPVCTVVLADGDHVQYAGTEIIPLLDDRTPCRPNSGGTFGEAKNVIKGFHILIVQDGVQLFFHVIRSGSALGVDIEHDEAVKSISFSNAFDALQGVVQSVGRGG